MVYAQTLGGFGIVIAGAEMSPDSGQVVFQSPLSEIRDHSI